MLIRKLHKEDTWNSGVMYLPLFECEIDVLIDLDVPEGYAERCAQQLVSLGDDAIDELCRRSIAYCEYMRRQWKEIEGDCPEISADIDEEMPEPCEGREILDFIEPTTLIICAPENELVPAFSLECECLWEPEHGLDWIVRGGRTLYASACSGIGPWCTDEEYAERENIMYS